MITFIYINLKTMNIITKIYNFFIWKDYSYTEINKNSTITRTKNGNKYNTYYKFNKKKINWNDLKNKIKFQFDNLKYDSTIFINEFWITNKKSAFKNEIINVNSKEELVSFLSKKLPNVSKKEQFKENLNISSWLKKIKIDIIKS